MYRGIIASSLNVFLEKRLQNCSRAFIVEGNIGNVAKRHFRTVDIYKWLWFSLFFIFSGGYYTFLFGFFKRLFDLFIFCFASILLVAWLF